VIFMPNRRVFLQTGAAVSAIAMNGVIVRSADALSGRSGLTLGRAIYDDRYAEGHRFAAAVAAHGVATRALDEGDITRFWYEELDTRWRHEPVALAGFTQYGPMFVIERFAAERRMRLVLRVEHRVERDSTLTHVVAGARETDAFAAELEAAGSDWPGSMASFVCRASDDGSPPENRSLAMPGSAMSLAPVLSRPTPAERSIIHYYTPLAVAQGHGESLEGPLYTWVVVPRG
jgi:hypothetical protein